MSVTIERTLPEELLNHIVSLVDRHTLLNLCFTSKTFNRLATPYLYSNIYLKETDHLPALAYLIFTSPTHAALVRSFIVPQTWGKEEEKFTEWSWPIPDDPNLPKMLRAKCAEYTPNDQEVSDMYEKIESGANEDAILALLLASLPRLQRLNINFGMCNRHPDFVAMWPIIINGMKRFGESPLAAARSQAAGPIPLSIPIDVMVKGPEDKYPNDPVHLAIFFHLPNVRSIYGWRVGDGDGGGDPETEHFAKLKPRTCPVEYIELRTSKLDMENFQYLLDATIPGKLKTFSYEVGCTWAWCKTEHPKIMASLQPHHATLESLGLSHEDYYPYEMGADSEKPYPCSFVPFTALKRLKVAPVYIWGHEGFTEKSRLESPDTKGMLWKTLPGNLEELWITRATHQDMSENNATVRFIPECLLPALDLVIQNKSEYFPKLESLRIELPLLKWRDEWLDILASLCRTAATRGIQSTIILCDMFDQYSKLTAERQWGWDEDIEWEPTRYSINTECAKIWITTAEHDDLGQVMKDVKARFKEEGEKCETATREINGLGPIPMDRINAAEYDASTRVNIPELARWVEQRTHMKSYSKAWSSSFTVET